LEKLFFNLNYPADKIKAINYLKEEADSIDKNKRENID
jgi:hypothetical protein